MLSRDVFSFLRGGARVLAAACCLLALTRAGSAQPAAGITEYFLTCDPDSFAAIYAAPHEDHYIPATLTVEGRSWHDVELRIRGDGSRSYPKKSLKLRFGGEPFVNGRDRLNFNGDYLDKSYLHTVLSSHLMRASGQPAFEAEHARLYLNGEFLGLYLRVENIDEAFLEARGLDPEGALFKAARDNASLSIFDDVRALWEKDAGDWDDLEQLISELETVPDESYPQFARETFDYERMINLLAMNMLIANGSTYYHNYFLYRAEGGRWIMLPWDFDLTLAAYGVSYPYHRSSGPHNPDNPFLERALLSAAVFADVRARIGELSATLFHPDHLYPKIDSLVALLEPSVAQDTTDDIPDLATWREGVAAVKGFIANRPAALRHQFATVPAPFRVFRRPEVTPEGYTLRWRASADPDGGAVTYTLRLGTDPTLLDDATAVYTGITDTTFTLPRPAAGTYYWLVSASDGTNEIDGYDTHNPFVVGSLDTHPLVVNEINYNSADDFDPGDWVELYNPNGRAVDLAGWRFQDGLALHSYVFPEGARIEAGGFAVLSRDVAAFQALFPGVTNVYGDLGFGLSGGGEAVHLYDAFGGLVDSLTYGDAAPWPEAADGTGHTLELVDPARPNHRPESWQASLRRGGTPGAVNSTATAAEHPAAAGRLELEPSYPNPVRSSAQIAYDLGRPGRVELRVYDLLGRSVQLLVHAERAAGRHTVTWEPADLAPGSYLYVLYLDGRRVAARTAVVVR